MKVCTICNRQYADSLKFCLDDGTVLTPAPAADVTLVDPQATLRLSARETEPAAAALVPKRRTGIVWIVLGGVGLMVVVAVAAVVLLLLISPASSPPGSDTRNSSASPAASPAESIASVQQDVERINNQVGNALVQGDPDALERLLADDYRYVSDVGLTLNKMEVLILIRTGNLSYEYLTTTDPKIDVNNDVNKAELTARASSKGQMRRQPFTDSYFYRNTYEKRDGRWQLVSGTAWHRQ
ncbi:MAG TPA: nuclear transport factor 2 family protein [Pyrinomonadaceae bacterium]|nr:nuclear transport factor 2 family protein [Pyrinomonadaceae bacterium]